MCHEEWKEIQSWEIMTHQTKVPRTIQFLEHCFLRGQPWQSESFVVFLLSSHQPDDQHLRICELCKFVVETNRTIFPTDIHDTHKIWTTTTTWMARRRLLSSERQTSTWQQKLWRLLQDRMTFRLSRASTRTGRQFMSLLWWRVQPVVGLWRARLYGETRLRDEFRK